MRRSTVVGLVARVLPFALPILASCGGAISHAETCGDGTYDHNGTCLPLSTSSSDAGASCGPGTVLSSGGQCVPASSSANAADSGAVDGGANPAAACLGPDNKFVIGGDDYVHSGSPLVITGGAGWSVDTDGDVDGKPAFVTIHIGSNWTIDLSSASLGRPLAPGTYVDAQRAPFTDPNHPGLDVFGDGRGCNEVGGTFTIVDVQANSDPDGGLSTVTSLTATFEQHCEKGSGSNTGCVHFTL